MCKLERRKVVVKDFFASEPREGSKWLCLEICKDTNQLLSKEVLLYLK